MMTSMVLALAVVAVAGGVAALARVVSGLQRHRALTIQERALAAACLATAVAFAALSAAFSSAAGPLAMDRMAHALFGALPGDPRETMVHALTALGDWRIHFAVLFVVGVPALRKRHGWLLAVYGGALTLTGLTILAFKSGLGRARPNDMLVALADRAFPSGHAAMGLAFWFAVGVFVGRLAPRMKAVGVALAITVPAAIAYTRLFLRVHWITDILGGWLLALFWLTLAVIVDRVSEDHPELARVRARISGEPARGPASASRDT